MMDKPIETIEQLRTENERLKRWLWIAYVQGLKIEGPESDLRESWYKKVYALFFERKDTENTFRGHKTLSMDEAAKTEFPYADKEGSDDETKAD